MIPIVDVVVVSQWFPHWYLIVMGSIVETITIESWRFVVPQMIVDVFYQLHCQIHQLSMRFDELLRMNCGFGGNFVEN